MNGNISEVGDARGAPGQRCLFCLRSYYPEIGLSGARVKWVAKHLVFRDVRCGFDGP